RDGGLLGAAAQTKNPSATQVVSLILGEMRKLGADSVATPELDSRKAVLIGNFGRRAETVSGIAGIVGGYVTSGVPLDELG
ncbi:hypothetical protein ACO1MN_16255, partial [Staphylococcus aureus]